MRFAPLVADARRRAGLTQAELADQIGVGTRAVWLIEQGGGTIRTLEPILSVLRIAISGLPPAPTLGGRVAAARRRRGWSLLEAAERSGLSIPTVRSLEGGRGRTVSLEALIGALAPTARERRVARPRSSSPPASGIETASEWPLRTSVLHGDCLDVMPTLAEGSVALVCTSPPYGAGKAYERDLSAAEYESFANAWVACLPRLLGPHGAAWINLGFSLLPSGEMLPLTYLYHTVFRRHGFRLMQELVWHYEGGLAYTRRFSPRTERWQWWVRDLDHYTFDLDAVRDGTLNRTVDGRNSPLGKNPTDYWYFDRIAGGIAASPQKTAHPCQFPLDMIERIVRACSRPGETVLDPFAGSGTTAVAAMRNGRGSISIERDPDYYEIARERIAAAGGARPAEAVLD